MLRAVAFLIVEVITIRFFENSFGCLLKTKAKRRHAFSIGKSVALLRDLMPDLPTLEDSYRLISVEGGFSSLSFILAVAEKEKILSLSVSTLRVGEKHIKVLDKLRTDDKIKNARFVVGGLMKENNKGVNYYDAFTSICDKNNWSYAVINNHSKIILMQTEENFYVLETSSNLNENPKIEQYCFENDKGLYDFYDAIFNKFFESEVVKM